MADFRFPGTVSHDFQEKEHVCNDYLCQSDIQRERGRVVRQGWVGSPVAGDTTVLKIQRDGKVHEVRASGRLPGRGTIR